MKKATKRYLLVSGILFVITCVAIGFAAFSNTLTIKSSAIVTPESNNFSIKLSSSETELEINPVTPWKGLASDSSTEVNDFTATDAVISNTSNPTISNISATFTQTNRVADYTFYVRNEGEYDAYLNEIKFNNVGGKENFKVCTAASGTTQSLVDVACEDINIIVMMDTEPVRISETTKLSGFKLAPGESTYLYVLVSYYSGDSNTSTAVADGDFTVEFGDIELIWSTVDVNAN